ncbi:MAG TPA: CpsD/CapB family tyrosine-protein kinase [Pyrinomonadaceae bacterium]|nr:CpsD/CapB family tyrosine-protein kinase [Pyrinomonadaceae bacterium]
MGRVYEALKRAAETNGGGKPKSATRGRGDAETRRLEDDDATTHAPSGVVREASNVLRESSNGSPSNGSHAPTPEHVLHPAQFFGAFEAATTSAPTERTNESHAGSALPGARASRDAGATLGAAGSARAAEFPSVEISAARVEPHLVAVTQPRSPHAERYRYLRTRLLHAGERRKMQAFVVTSAGVMEGKTLTALNLSWLLAQTDGVRALLIDGDLRQPCAADYLALDAPTGLSEVLGGEASLQESIVRLDPAGLYFLPGGTARDDVAELLSGPRFAAVLREARQMFDYVIIDAPPLGIFTDAAVLVDRADGCLIVARSGRTRYAALDRLIEPLPRERILGVVLNGADEEFNGQDYYYQRRYYGGGRPRHNGAGADAKAPRKGSPEEA